METQQMTIVKDASNKKLKITRSFNAPVTDVWRAWTDSNLLDQWWAPRPWKAETKSFSFVNGKSWLYAMVGPDGSKHWNNVKYNAIDPLNYFETTSIFCDENGVQMQEFPTLHWKIKFISQNATTKLEIEICFDVEADMLKIIEMGFEAGFSMGLQNLDELLATF